MRVHSAQISRALDEVVMRALCKDKQLRYQSAAEMAADLRMTISKPRGGFVRYPTKREEAQPEPYRSHSSLFSSTWAVYASPVSWETLRTGIQADSQ